MQEFREQLIQDIKMLINSADEKLVEINPKLLDYFSFEDLEQLKADLIVKKRDFLKNNATWLDSFLREN